MRPRIRSRRPAFHPSSESASVTQPASHPHNSSNTSSVCMGVLKDLMDRDITDIQSVTQVIQDSMLEATECARINPTCSSGRGLLGHGPIASVRSGRNRGSVGSLIPRGIDLQTLEPANKASKLRHDVLQVVILAAEAKVEGNRGTSAGLR